MLVGIKELTNHPMAKIYYTLDRKGGETFEQYIERVDKQNRKINKRFECYNENGDWVGYH